jgi:hypothetical protein
MDEVINTLPPEICMNLPFGRRNMRKATNAPERFTKYLVMYLQ